MSRTALLSAGHYLPDAVEWLGVRRPIEPEPAGTSELGARAAREALEREKMTPADVDFIIFATINPDVTFPGSACYLQDKLGCDTVGALDIRAQCSGFVYALSVADQFVRTGDYRRVLIVGGELHSVWVDVSAQGADLARRFGDGAGAVVLGPREGDSGLLAAVCHADGSRHDRFWCEYPASRQHPVRLTAENMRAGLHYPKMDVEEMRRFGAAVLPRVIREAAEGAAVRLESVDRLIVSHVLPEVASQAAAELGVEAARLSNPSAEHGHLGAAALPVALSREIAAGSIGAGSLVCLAAAGAGLTWGAALLRL